MVGYKVRLRPGAIQKLWDEKGITKSYRQVSREFGCHDRMISLYLTDQIKNPSLEMLLNWADLLQVDYMDLIIITKDD